VRLGKAAAICLPLLLVGVAGYAVLTADPARSQHGPHPHRAEAAIAESSPAWPGACAQPERRELGVVAPVRSLSGYPASTGVSPNIAEFYTTFGSPFWAGAFNAAEAIGAVPLMQWNPESLGIASIAAGHQDAYLRRFAAAVRAYRCPVILSFGHEMNGNWFPWGYEHTSPVVFVAAWRRIVDIFASQRASNVTWLWTVNTEPAGNNDVSPLAPWWPGAAYVSWVGVDGYYRSAGDTFESLFGNTLPQIRQLAPDAPVLITETAVDVKAPAALAQLADLFSGVGSQHLRGLVWFDIKAEEDWALEDNPAVLAAFRAAAATWLGSQ
jgi:mannan endo-1,4-beta-mannosidase